MLLYLCRLLYSEYYCSKQTIVYFYILVYNSQNFNLDNVLTCKIIGLKIVQSSLLLLVHHRLIRFETSDCWQNMKIYPRRQKSATSFKTLETHTYIWENPNKTQNIDKIVIPDYLIIKILPMSIMWHCSGMPRWLLLMTAVEKLWRMAEIYYLKRNFHHNHRTQ